MPVHDVQVSILMCAYCACVGDGDEGDVSSDNRVEVRSHHQSGTVYDKSERWLRVAVVVVPIAGSLILVMLVLFALRLLRMDSKRQRASCLLPAAVTAGYQIHHIEPFNCTVHKLNKAPVYNNHVHGRDRTAAYNNGTRKERTLTLAARDGNVLCAQPISKYQKLLEISYSATNSPHKPSRPLSWAVGQRPPFGEASIV